MNGRESDEYSGWEILDAAPVGVTILDSTAADAPSVYVNDQFLELTDYSRSDVLGSGYRLLVGPETRPEQLQRVERAIADGMPAAVELRTYRNDGTTFWSRVRLTPLTDDRGEVDKILLFHEDITDQRERGRTLEALNRFAGRVQSESSVAAICDRTVDTAAQTLGFDHCLTFISDGGSLCVRASTIGDPPNGLQNTQTETGIISESYRDGESRLVGDATDEGLSWGPYRSGLCVPIGEFGVFQAVRTEPNAFDGDDSELAELLARHTATAIERVEREQELRDRNERLEKFADVVSHDLRNPLSVLGGSLELAQRTGNEEYFDRARHAVERMSRLIDGLLELARQGGGISELEPVELVAVAEAGWATVVTETAGLSIRTDQTIRANEERVRQLLENLFRNAIEHGDAWEITLGELPDRSGFYIEDDGAGIPTEQYDAVFESGYTTAEDGTGFGLAICKRIADAHGWEIAISDGQNGGTRVEISGVEIVTHGGRQ